MRPSRSSRVGQAFAQRELAQPRRQQRLERVGQRAAEQLHRAGVDQAAQQRAAAVPPQGGEVLERLVGLVDSRMPKVRNASGVHDR